jgi:hypothetical protein
MVSKDRVLTLQLPEDVEPGEHRITLTIENNTESNGNHPPLRLSKYNVGLVSDTTTFRREEHL